MDGNLAMAESLENSKEPTTLHLNLKAKWFDMIASGEKLEEYREIKDYWCGRFVAFLWVSDMAPESHSERLTSGNYNKASFMFDYDTITFSNGYAKNRRQFVIESKGIEIRTGKEKWGAPPGVKYFVLPVGKILSKNF